MTELEKISEVVPDVPAAPPAPEAQETTATLRPPEVEPLTRAQLLAMPEVEQLRTAGELGVNNSPGAVLTACRLAHVWVSGGRDAKMLGEHLRVLPTRVAQLARAGWIETQVLTLLPVEPRRCREYWSALVDQDGAEFSWSTPASKAIRKGGEAADGIADALCDWAARDIKSRTPKAARSLRERFIPKRVKGNKPVVSSVEKDAPAPALDVQDANGLVAAVVAEIRKSLLPRPALLGAVLVELLSDGADIAAALRPVVKKWNFGDPNTGGGLAESKELMLGLMRAIGEYGQVQGASSALAGAAVAYGEALGNASHATAAHEAYQIAGVIAENLRPFLPRTARKGKPATVADVAAQQIDSASRAALVAECVSAVA